MSQQKEISEGVKRARVELYEHVEPRDDFEHAVIDALGEISWDEAIAAIEKHRATDSGTEKPVTIRS
jgi:hypothetical protein